MNSTIIIITFGVIGISLLVILCLTIILQICNKRIQETEGIHAVKDFAEKLKSKINGFLSLEFTGKTKKQYYQRRGMEQSFQWAIEMIDDAICELYGKDESLAKSEIVELPQPFIGTDKNAKGETTYLVYRSRIDIYCPAEDIYTDKSEAERRLKELKGE